MSKKKNSVQSEKARLEEEKMRELAIKARKINYIIYAITVAFFLIFIITGSVYSKSFKFTSERWIEKPDKRTKIVDNLMEENDLHGMTQDEIEALLGENDNDTGFSEKENRFIYYLGDGYGFIRSSDKWLIIDFEGGLVKDYYLTADADTDS